VEIEQMFRGPVTSFDPDVDGIHDQGFVEFDPVFRERPAIAFDPFRHRVQGPSSYDDAEAPVSLFNQVRGGFLGGGKIVTHHRWNLHPFHCPIDEHERDSARVDLLGCRGGFSIFARRRRQDDAVNPVFQKCPGMSQFFFDAFIRVAHDHLVTVAADGVFDCAQDHAKEGIADVSDDHPNGEAGALLHAAGQGIGAVMELSRRFQNPLAGGGRHFAVSAQGPPGGCDRRAGLLGDIFQSSYCGLYGHGITSRLVVNQGFYASLKRALSQARLNFSDRSHLRT
jgi:hypothetical protein